MTTIKQSQVEEIELLREALISARVSGITNMTPDQILAEIKEELQSEREL